MYNFTNVLDSLLREDFKSFCIKVFQELNPSEKFVDGWYINLICDYMQRVMNGEELRLIINIPPRYLKSIICSIAFPAFVLGHNPNAKIMCISYSEELASKLATDCRAIMQTKWYKEQFPKTVINPNRNSVMDFETTKHGVRYATTVGGATTGRGADYIIIDDPVKPMDALSDVMREKVNDTYSTAIGSRLNNKNTGRIVVIMQRLHENDLSGYLEKKDIGYKTIKLPIMAAEDEEWKIKNHINNNVKTVYRKKGELLHPIREGMNIVEQHRKSCGAFIFSAQYQQNPVPIGLGLIKREMLSFYSNLPMFNNIVISWDTGAKISENNSFSACVVIGISKDDKCYLLDIFRERLEFPFLIRKFEEIASKYEESYPNRVTILVEDASSGIQLLQHFKQRRTNIKPIKCLRGKEDRFNFVTLKVERQELLLPQNFTPWYKDFEEELLTFPRSLFKDQCDALSQALNYLEANKNMYSSNALVGARPGMYEKIGSSLTGCTGGSSSFNKFNSDTALVGSRGRDPYASLRNKGKFR